jgi:hypothetical protein
MSAVGDKEFNMSISSVSVGRPTWSHIGHAAASHGKRTEGAAESSDASTRAESPPRRDRLVSAMMQALQGLAPAAADAAPAPAASSPTDAAAAADAAPAPATTASSNGGLTDAAMAFAHELVAALRSGSEGNPGRHLGWTRGYGNLAHRLDALAQTLATSVPTGSTTTPAATTPPTTDPAVPATASTPTPAAPAPTAPGAAPASTDSPLLAAFQRLLTALTPTTQATSGDSTAQRLADFLRTMAAALVPGRDAVNAAAVPGSLLDVSA